ncbi:uncharacterized protein BO72DRAFT_303439 [Aspergillus fijiensis CBS 313.89]|uniref:Uncharacterized protein n=1 Tax=Aspergillus fijiensis CBS 313.89 TaxID=1448319 RepID=A0A8G1RX64_9EURO|nr:uncharacterized protein BO72DRAFT_303439 [Aspergillus fijiensis CBS 313.89]RAK80382.1 hypothetical protein BO72DRAFT_303439 [Aspergillus fijiensis CBS 313.89]
MRLHTLAAVMASPIFPSESTDLQFTVLITPRLLTSSTLLPILGNPQVNSPHTSNGQSPIVRSARHSPDGFSRYTH